MVLSISKSSRTGSQEINIPIVKDIKSFWDRKEHLDEMSGVQIQGSEKNLEKRGTFTSLLRRVPENHVDRG